MGEKINETKQTKEKKVSKDIRLTFKEDEQDIKEYLESKSSATCFLKDLARIEMERERRILETANANVVLEQIKQLLEQKEPQTPIFNLTAQIGSVQAVGGVTSGSQQHETEDLDDDDDFDLDISDLDGI